VSAHMPGGEGGLEAVSGATTMLNNHTACCAAAVPAVLQLL
jgi:hypothetical protein